MALRYILLVPVLALLLGALFFKFLLRLLGWTPPPGPRNRELFVADYAQSAVFVFGVDASGFLVQPPVRTIAPAPPSQNVPQLQSCWDVAVDHDGYAFVLNRNIQDDGSDIPDPFTGVVLPTVVVLPPDADSTVAPVSGWPRALLPTITTPQALAVTRTPESLLIALSDPNFFANSLSAIFQVPRLSSDPRFAVISSSDIFPIGGLASDGTQVAVTQPFSDAVLLLDWQPFQQGNTAATSAIKGDRTTLKKPFRATFDAGGRLYVTNWGNGAGDAFIAVFDKGAQGNVAPIRYITSSSSFAEDQLKQPMGIAVDDAGQIYVADSGRVLVFEAGANGARQPKQVVTLPNDGSPIGLAFHVPVQ